MKKIYQIPNMAIIDMPLGQVLASSNVPFNPNPGIPASNERRFEFTDKDFWSNDEWLK